MGWLLDRIVLRGTRHPLPGEGLSRQWLRIRDLRIELFQLSTNCGVSASASLHVIKFLGAAGRAENASLHPFDHWHHRAGVVTVANPPGYGNSPGRARLADLVDLAEATYRHVLDQAGNAPILLCGSSLGGAVAICLAGRLQATESRRRPAGIVVRDAPQLNQVIWQRFGWKSGWLPAWMLSRNVPESLNVARAAEKCAVPAVIVSSQRDRVVPPAVQQYWIERYQGPKRLIKLPDAGHYDPMSPRMVAEYLDALDWLYPRERSHDPQPRIVWET